MKRSEKFWLMMLILFWLVLMLGVHWMIGLIPLFMYLMLCFLDVGINMIFKGGKYNIIEIIKRGIIKFNNYLDK